MYSTDQFRVFATPPSERALSRPRRLLQEGRVTEAEVAYRTVLAAHPDMRQAWIEAFALLRAGARHSEALALAEEADLQFGGEALPSALRGAALVELGRYRDGLEALDDAAQRDPNLGLVWHEAGYAAYRLGEFSRALMALDRAFALEPHGSTLQLRGQVLRQAGRYLAAEVAFEGAAEAAEFPGQREEARAEIDITRRYARFQGTKPEALDPASRWFADAGGIPLTSGRGRAPTDAELGVAFAGLAREAGWRFSVLVALDAWEGWYDLARALTVPVAAELSEGDLTIPLIVARHPADVSRWFDLAHTVSVTRRGLAFALHQPPALWGADIGGIVGDTGELVAAPVSLELVHHPECRLAGRRLG
ncbi:MAG: tetratricopeptide repeat protein [Gemmatimonadales bacterium]